MQWIQNMRNLLDSIVSESQGEDEETNLSKESILLIDELRQLLVLLDKFLKEVNKDEIIQKMIHHSILATRISLEQQDRRRKLKSSILMEEIQFKNETVNELQGSVLPNLVKLISGGELARIFNDFVGLFDRVLGSQDSTIRAQSFPGIEAEMMEAEFETRIPLHDYSIQEGVPVKSITPREVETAEKLYEETFPVKVGKEKQLFTEETTVPTESVCYSKYLAVPLSTEDAFDIINRLRLIMTDLKVIL
jgi:hypothetical protein